MSFRPSLGPYPVITNGDMSLASITSKVTILTNLSMISYGVSWVGTAPVGTVSVQVSNDYSENQDGSVRNAGTWNDLPVSSAVSGGTGNGFIDIDALAGYAIRLVYTRASGSGLIQAILKAKVS